MNNNENLAKLAINKSLLREYSNSSNERIVYMNDGTEFQIQIFNPYSYVIGVTFKFNDTSESNQLLVLRPGERVWLDRYLNKESRLLFSTYEVGTSEEVKKAIANNGNLQIKFYKEKENNYIISPYTFTSSINKWDSGVYYNDLENSYCSTKVNLKAYDDTSLSCDISGDITGVSNVNYSRALDTTINGLNDYVTSSSASTSTSVSYSTADYTNKPLRKVRSRSMETGRIEEGSHSNQKFNNVYKDFEIFPFKTEYIKILPMSQKQVNSNDISKRYCYNCGRKLNQKYVYCPFCGTKQ